MRRIRFTENRFWIALLIVVIAFNAVISIARADIGGIEICNGVTGSTTHDTPLSANTETAQGFTLTTGTTIAGVKLPLQRIGSPAGTVTVRITATTTNSAGIVVPDITTAVYITDSYSKLSFPAASGTATDQTLTCNLVSNDPGGTAMSFTTPTYLPPGTYAIVVDATSTPGDMQWGVPISSPTYAGGICSNNSNSANENDPDDWLRCYGGDTDSGFVVYNNIVPVVTEGTFDSWLDNFLSSLGMNSPVGRLLVGSLFAGVLFFVLAIKEVPWIISLGITGFAVVTMTAAMVFNPAILLGLIAIVGVASIGLIFSLFIGGGDRGG